MKGPVGLERLQSDADLALLERALDQNLSSQRDVGVVLWGDVAGGIVQYIAGVFNGDPDNSARRRGHQLREGLRRAAVLPSLPDRGAARLRQPRRRAGGADRQPQGPPSHQRARRPRPASRRTGPPVRTRSSSTWRRRPTRPARRRCSRTSGRRASTRSSTTTTARSACSPSTCGCEQGVQKGNTTTQLTQQAAHATASFTIGGTEDYDGATPEHAFDPGAHHLGALQLAVRFGWLGIDDATFPTYANPLTSARTAKGIAGGANWVLRRSFRVGLLYEQTWFEGGAGTAATAIDAGDDGEPADRVPAAGAGAGELLISTTRATDERKRHMATTQVKR